MEGRVTTGRPPTRQQGMSLLSPGPALLPVGSHIWLSISGCVSHTQSSPLTLILFQLPGCFEVQLNSTE